MLRLTAQLLVHLQGTELHQDPPGTSTWNMVTTGRKRWAMLSPQCPMHLAGRSSPPEGCDWSVKDWFGEEWPALMMEAEAAGWAAFDFEQAPVHLSSPPPCSHCLQRRDA